jgi:hypothetical protein
MRTGLVAFVGLMVALTGCGDGPPEMATDPTEPSGTPTVRVSDHDATTVGYLVGDDFLNVLVAGLEDRGVALRLDNTLRDLDAALSGTDREVLLHTLSGSVADHVRSPTDLAVDDQLAVAVFQIMLGHTEWLLTRPAESATSEDTIAPTERPSSDSQRTEGAVLNHE